VAYWAVLPWKEERMRLPSAIVTIAVLTAYAWYYFLYRGFPVSASFVNAVTAFSATVLITLSFALGPVTYWIARIRPWRTYRKDFGLIGYALACAHILISAWYVLDRDGPIAYSDAMSLTVAAVSFAIFSTMAITSNSTWIRRLGYENWKALQRTGYMALVLLFLHIGLLSQGAFFERITGQIALFFMLAVLLLRALALLIQVVTPSPRAAKTTSGHTEGVG
jgi:DMSO/TMAO reductase YedYZ heme-binding membrane subunit